MSRKLIVDTVLYDAHAHMNMLSEKELKEALSGAKKNNVGKIVSCSTSFESNRQNLLLAKKFPEIKAAIGLYPLDAMELSDGELENAFSFFKSKANEAIGFGEVGLDYKYAKKESAREKQQEILKRFVELSKETGKPLIVHSRYAQRPVLELLIEEGAEKVLLHSFVDSEKLMKEAGEQGYCISAGLALLWNKEIQSRIIKFPVENLLFETDCPMRFGGKKAFSHKILDISKKVAELKGIKLEEVETAQEKNFHELFRN